MVEPGNSAPDGRIPRKTPKVCHFCGSSDKPKPCDFCDTGLFCGVDCWEGATREGQHDCKNPQPEQNDHDYNVNNDDDDTTSTTTTTTTSASASTTARNLAHASIWSLVQGVLRRTLPTDDRALHDYFFDRCASAEDKQRLLVLYQDVLLGVPGMTARHLHGWMEEKAIHRNLVELFNTHTTHVTPRSFMWLYLHRSVFDDGESDMSGRLRLQEYLDKKEFELGELEEFISLTEAFC